MDCHHKHVLPHCLDIMHLSLAARPTIFYHFSILTLFAILQRVRWENSQKKVSHICREYKATISR